MQQVIMNSRTEKSVDKKEEYEEIEELDDIEI